MNLLEFPENFWWGAATSGPQTEGRFNKKNKNTFDHWYDSDPNQFYENVGPNTASNFYNSYKEDIALYKKVGMNSVRISIQWTRLIDDFEKGTINEDAKHFYESVINELISQGIEPLVNLHHFDLPIELYEKYSGWESKKVVDLFVLYATRCFELFQDKVKYWFVFNEPLVAVEGQYLWKFHYPLIMDGERAVQVSYNMILATAKVIRAFKQFDNKDIVIGTILNLTPTYAASQSDEDLKAAEIANLWRNEMFLSPAIKGTFPEKLVDLLRRENVLWESTDEENKIIKNNTIDLLGVNYYHPFRAKEPDVIPSSASKWLPDIYYDNYKMPGRLMNMDKGWEIYPKAVYDISKNIQKNYGNIDWFISENGIGVSKEERYLENGQVNDYYRIEFIEEHLKWLHKAITEGANCKGYHLWTAIDNWSWKNAYKNRYGLIANDIATQIKTVKKSGEWFKEVAETNKLNTR